MTGARTPASRCERRAVLWAARWPGSPAGRPTGRSGQSSSAAGWGRAAPVRGPPGCNWIQRSPSRPSGPRSSHSTVIVTTAIVTPYPDQEQGTEHPPPPHPAGAGGAAGEAQTRRAVGGATRGDGGGREAGDDDGQRGGADRGDPGVVGDGVGDQAAPTDQGQERMARRTRPPPLPAQIRRRRPAASPLGSFGVPAVACCRGCGAWRSRRHAGGR